MDAGVETYLAKLVSAVDEQLSGNLAAAWLVGSLATSDFRAEASDIDVLVISRDRVSDDAKARLTSLLRHAVLPVPTHGLDLVIYRESEVRGVRRDLEYEYSLATGPAWTDEVSNGGAYPGGILDLGLARGRGVALHGPAPPALIGPIPDQWLIEELAATVRWHATRVHDPFHDPSGTNAVLNACRALHYLAEREFVSKSAGAEWLLSQGAPDIVKRALAHRAAGSRDALDERDVLLFLDDAARRFERAPR